MFFRRKLFPFSRFIVHDYSMMPFYKSGDHVLTLNWGTVKKGDAIVFSVFVSLRVESSRRGNLVNRLLRFARNDEKRYLIKRIDKIEGKLVFVSGDNKLSISLIGPISQDQIIGKVILKY